MPGEWSNPERVVEYLGREIPHREIAEGLLLDALPARVTRVLDLGTGDGRLLAVVRSQHPGAHGVGLDSSEPMLQRAAERFASDAAIELVEHDLNQPLTELAAAERPFDVVVSGLAVHHLEDERKRALFGEVRALLTPGGVFANLDLVTPSTQALHERFRRAIGRVQDDPEDRLAGFCEQIDWLRDAGFAEADCHFKWLELALFVAVRSF